MKKIGLIKRYRQLPFKERANISSKVSMIVNFSWSILKAVVGMFTNSVFLLISALYTSGIGFAKNTYYSGLVDCEGDIKEEKRYYFRIAMILTISTLLYMVYMIRLFFIPSHIVFKPVVAIAIAAFSFCELGIAIHGIIKSNRLNDLLLSGLKTINLVSSFMAIVLTQVAILSFSSDIDSSFYNAIAGVGFSLLSLIVCAFMFYNYFKVSAKIEKDKLND